MSSSADQHLPTLRAVGVTRAFGPTVALSEASLEVRAGEVHALLGENGAGKSTFVKILSGLVRPDAGEIWVAGERVELSSRRAAHRFGLQTAFQEVPLVPDLTVVQNVLMPFAPSGVLWQIKARQAHEIVAEELVRLGLGDIDPRAEIRELSLNLRQKIEIARAIIRRPRILFLDEPTASLSGRDVGWLGDQITRLRSEGVAIVFVSHRIPEVRAFCDRITILRNGKNVGTYATGAVTNEEVINLIIGRSLEAAFPPKAPRPRVEAPRLSVRALAVGDRLAGVDLDLRPGEILGVAGLQGMGQRELFLGMFGALPRAGGEIRLDSRLVRIATPRNAIDLGICLVPEERKTEGIFLNLSGGANVSITSLSKLQRHGLVDRLRENVVAATALARVQVDERALYTPVRAFSGGNQQKIAIAKWLTIKSRVLLMFDPTRGVDVGTKSEIFQLMNDYVAAGGAILFYSTEIAELTNLAHRIVVLYGGRVAAEFDNGAGPPDENVLMRAMLGGVAPVVEAATEA
jgi:ribose transport system ATP-binding protein